MSFITEIKTSIMHSIETYYGFDTSRAPDSISYNASRAYRLLSEMTFIYRVRHISLRFSAHTESDPTSIGLES
jgi:hypothetical protein